VTPKQANKMKKEHQNLWLKIARFPLNDINAAYPFSSKLAKEQGWSEDKTLQVIAEYKKFMFLCMTAPNGASPSVEVDECWHLHLTFTANYAAFCAETAGKFIHHNPSKGGTTEHHRHIDWYEETLKNYVETFQQMPPSDIWTLPEGFKPAAFLPKSSPMHPLSIKPFLTPSWTNLNDNSTEYYACLSILIGILATIPFVGNPYALDGYGFLTFYSLLGFALIFFISSFNALQEKHVENNVKTLYDAQLSAYKTAFFVGGGHRLVQTIALELIDKGMLTKMPDETNSDKLLMLDTSADFDETLLHNPLYLTLQTVEKQTITPNFLKGSLYSFQLFHQEEIADLNLAGFPTDIKNVMSFLFLGVGLCRIFQGLSNHKPTGFVIGLMVIYMLIHSIWQFNKTSLNNIITRVFRWENSDTKPFSLPHRYAIEGRDALATASFTNIALALALVSTDWGLPNQKLGNEGSNSFICGGAVETSSSGGDGDGGCSGGDGGGCGGCGGCGCGD
jgi:hypothetical protein